VCTGAAARRERPNRIQILVALDYANQSASKDIEFQVVKAVAGFMNSESGGTVIVGISDRKEILGLEQDYLTLKGRKDRDGFEQILYQILDGAIGRHMHARLPKFLFAHRAARTFA
jgi:hypothetical protein